MSHQPSNSNESKDRLYKIWSNMKQRCNNKKNDKYAYYGGRGITLSESWHTFQNFYDDMIEEYIEHSLIHGESDTTIDRIDNDGNYCKENCRWATKKVQQRNKQHKSEFIGATKRRSKWLSQFWNGTAMQYLGVFKTPQEAQEAHLKAKQKYHEQTK